MNLSSLKIIAAINWPTVDDVSVICGPELISLNYAAQLRAMHARVAWGDKVPKFANSVLALVGKTCATTILDYGCGAGALKRVLPGFDVREYDPGIAEKSALPEPADVVVCLDVLEHIEPEKLPAVLDHLAEMTLLACVVSIATRPAKKRLPDGRNAHLIIDNGSWWRQQFLSRGWRVSVRYCDALDLLMWLRRPAR